MAKLKIKVLALMMKGNIERLLSCSNYEDTDNMKTELIKLRILAELILEQVN